MKSSSIEAHNTFQRVKLMLHKKYVHINRESKTKLEPNKKNESRTRLMFTNKRVVSIFIKPKKKKQKPNHNRMDIGISKIQFIYFKMSILFNLNITKYFLNTTYKPNYREKKLIWLFLSKIFKIILKELNYPNSFYSKYLNLSKLPRKLKMNQKQIGTEI